MAGRRSVTSCRLRVTSPPGHPRGGPGCGRRPASTPPRPGPSPAERRGRRATTREHRLQRAQEAEADRGQCLLSAAEGQGGDLRQIARQHRCSPHHRWGHTRRPGHRVDHDPFERALAQLAQEQPAQEVGLRFRRPSEQVGQGLGAGGAGAGPFEGRQRVQGPVQVADGERRVGRRRDRHGGERRPPDADASLARLPAEQGDGRRHLVAGQRAEQLGEDGHLPGAGGRGAHPPGGGDEVGQEHGHRPSLACGTAASARARRRTTARPPVATVGGGTPSPKGRKEKTE